MIKEFLSKIFNDPILFLKRKGVAGDSYKPLKETLTITNGKVYLREIPNKAKRVTVEGNNIYWQEQIDNNFTELEDNLFQVDYVNGLVYFNSAHEGKTVTVSYLGEGVIYFPDSRVYLTNQPEFVTFSEKLDDLDRVDNEQKNRVDTLIIETPQPSEVVDLRVDRNGLVYNTARERVNILQKEQEDTYTGTNGNTYPSMKNRFDSIDTDIEAINEEIVIIDNKLNQIVYNLDVMFPRLDSETDDAPRLQRAVDYLLQNGGGVLLIPTNLTCNQSVNVFFKGYAHIKIIAKHGVTISKPTGSFAIFDIGTTVATPTLFSDRIQNVSLYNLRFESPDSTGNAIKLRNFSRIYFENIIAYRFNNGLDIAAGSELFVNGYDWAGGNCGLLIDVPDGKGGSGGAIDMQMIKFKRLIMSNGLRNVNIINAYNVEFIESEFVSYSTNKNIIIESCQQVSFKGCIWEWQNYSSVECNGFIQLNFTDCEWGSLSGTNTNPILAKSTTNNASINLRNAYVDGVILPIVKFKTGSYKVKVNSLGSFPVTNDYAVTYEDELLPWSTIEKGHKGFFNERFSSNINGMDQTKSTLTLTYDTTSYLTGSGSLKLDSSTVGYAAIPFNSIFDDNLIVIDLVIKNTHSAGVMRVVERDYGTNSYERVIQEQGATVLVQSFGDWNRYVLCYTPTKDRLVYEVRISNSQKIGTPINIDTLDIRTLKDVGMLKKYLESLIP